jgi:cell division protein FtsB
MNLKGRHWVLLWLVLFLAVTGIVVTRQTSGIRTARRLGQLRLEHRTLDARRAELERQIREASSRDVLSRHAIEALGLHQPGDSELVVFVVPAPRR